MKKMPGDIILHMCTKSYDHVWFPRYGGQWTDGVTENVTSRGACPTYKCSY